MRNHERESRPEESGWLESYAAITRELDFDERREDPLRPAPRRLARRKTRAQPGDRS